VLYYRSHLCSRHDDAPEPVGRVFSDLEVLPGFEQVPRIGRNRRGVVGDPAGDALEPQRPPVPGATGDLDGFDSEIEDGHVLFEKPVRNAAGVVCGIEVLRHPVERPRRCGQERSEGRHDLHPAVPDEMDRRDERDSRPVTERKLRDLHALRRDCGDLETPPGKLPGVFVGMDPGEDLRDVLSPVAVHLDEPLHPAVVTEGEEGVGVDVDFIVLEDHAVGAPVGIGAVRPALGARAPQDGAEPSPEGRSGKLRKIGVPCGLQIDGDQ